MSDAPLDFPTPSAAPVAEPMPLDDRGASAPLSAGDRDNERLSVCAAFWAY
ncbi:MAG TPA: hypothetical protein VMQ73_12290 [Methylomirabilota bacterium]|nr:hypothetical protein [Methylomirabilota bacterium]